jgi:spermidine synthase
MTALIAILFACSGCAGLIFEVLWTRQFSLVLGSTVQSGALVAGTFLFMLGLGARLGSGLSRRGHPLLVYAGLEMVAALTGTAVTWLLPRTTRLPFLLGDSPFMLALGRCLLAFSLLCLPCLAMGASLPVLCSWLKQRDSRFYLANLARLYAVNTLGAVAGVLLADWVLIQRWGLFRTGMGAAALDFLVGLVALLLWRASSRNQVSVEDSAPGRFPGLSRELLLLFGLGICGSLLQVVWTRSLIVFHGTDVRAFSTCLVTYLAGISLGGGLAALAPAGWTRANRLLYACLSLATVAGLTSLVALKWTIQVANPWLATLFTIAPTATCLGAAFPLASEAFHRRWPHDAEVAGVTVLVNTLGSLIGALLTAFVMLPNLGLQFSMICACLLLAVLMGLSALQRGAMIGSAVLLGAGLLLGNLYPSDYLKGLLYPNPAYHWLFWGEDAYGSVGLVEESIPEWNEVHEILLVDGYNMMGGDLLARRYATAIGALPVLLQSNPRNGLVICFGLAHTVSTVLGMDEIESVDCVELSKTVIQATSRLPRCEKAQQDPKMHLKIADGRHHLETTAQRYSLVVAEPPPPHSAGVVNLYSREYYQACRRCLLPGGMVVQWLPVFELSRRDGKVIIRAFSDVFPNCYLIDGGFDGELLLLGTDQPLSIDYANFKARADRVGERLRAAGWDSSDDLLASLIAGPKRLREYCENSPALTDDWPVLQYEQEFRPDYPELFLKDFSNEIPIRFATSAQAEGLERMRAAQRLMRTYLYRARASQTDPDKMPWVSPLLSYEAGRAARRMFPDSAYILRATLTEDGFWRNLRKFCDTPQVNVGSLHNLARIEFLRGDNEQALVRVEQAQKLSPDAFTEAFRIFLLWELNRKPEARQALAQSGPSLTAFDRDYLLQRCR